MPSMYEKVLEFQEHIVRYPLPDRFTWVSRTVLEGQVQHVFEEINELIDARLEEDAVKFADAIGDAIYVLIGIAARHGVDIDRVFTAIHAANMRKVSGVTRRNIGFDAVKPEGWVGPEAEIAAILKL